VYNTDQLTVSGFFLKHGNIENSTKRMKTDKKKPDMAKRGIKAINGLKKGKIESSVA